ncbi:RNA polymerase sigma factor [Flaviaesturariibacter amylovorans]|uniref:RNA polymerase sigma factor n=1 Tax=Flaviaesturariibacter amylovorans TaxID=1084520 RepID=A0ABP8GBX1_9BACT
MGIQEFNSLVISNAEGLRPFAITLTRDREAAQDLYQETLFKAFAHRDKYQPGTNIKAWLSTIMRNIFINEYRRNERKRVVLDNVLYAERYNNHSFTAERNVRLKEINTAIYRLPAIFKKACLLYLQGYKYQEIAEALNEPLGTIKSRIHFARKMLQKQIDR